MPELSKDGETQDSSMQRVYSSECMDRVLRFFLLLDEIPVMEEHAQKAPAPNDLPGSN